MTATLQDLQGGIADLVVEVDRLIELRHAAKEATGQSIDVNIIKIQQENQKLLTKWTTVCEQLTDPLLANDVQICRQRLQDLAYANWSPMY
jgi:hypothetical protein